MLKRILATLGLVAATTSVVACHDASAIAGSQRAPVRDGRALTSPATSDSLVRRSGYIYATGVSDSGH